MMRLRGSMRALWAAAAMMAVAATGCNDYKCNDYSAYERIADSGWLYGDTLTFVPVHDDSICRGRLAVAVSHDIRYPYTSLWLEVAHTSGRTGALMRDTLAIPVVDRYGTWIGHGIGATFQVSDTVASSFHRTGTPVYVRQIMRCDTLVGVNRVGLFFVSDK